MPKLTTSTAYCGIPYNPQPHNGFKLSSPINQASKENKAQIKERERELEQAYKLWCYIRDNKLDKISLQFRGNYIDVSGTFNITNEEFMEYKEEQEND